MGFKCAVTGCKSRYVNSSTASSVNFFSFPLRNENLLKLWLAILSRKDFSPTYYSRICSLHFADRYVVERSADTNTHRSKSRKSPLLLKTKRLSADAIPTIFPDSPKCIKKCEALKQANVSSGDESNGKPNNLEELKIKHEPVEEDSESSQHVKCAETETHCQTIGKRKKNSSDTTSQEKVDMDFENFSENLQNANGHNSCENENNQEDIKSEPIAWNSELDKYGENWLSYEVKKEEMADNSSIPHDMNMDLENSEDVLQNSNTVHDWHTNNVLNNLLPSTSGLGHSQLQANSEIVAGVSINKHQKSSSNLEQIININHEKSNSNLNESLISNLSKNQKKKKSYPCEICNKSFSRPDSLRRHLNLHSGEKTFECDICCRSFYDSSALNGHKRTHTGEKPYKCDICNRAFSQSSSLHTHKRIHTGERPYVCDVCNKSFAHSTALREHLSIHTKEKPFECDICRKSFAKISNLRVHIRTHTGDKPFRCDICNRSFGRAGNFRQHKRTVHKNIQECN